MKGIAGEKLASVRVPAGLEIGAHTAEEIALSIMAEIVSERRRGAGATPDPASRVQEPTVQEPRVKEPRI